MSTHGVMTRFELNCSGILANDSLQTLGPFIITYNASMFYFDFRIENLFPNTIYNVTLVGCTTIGCSPRTNITFKTLEMGELTLFFFWKNFWRIFYIDSISTALMFAFPNFITSLNRIWVQVLVLGIRYLFKSARCFTSVAYCPRKLGTILLR